MTVRTAVIPAAGWGTRLLPATKAVPKELLPVLDKPVLQYVVEEAVASGIERIIVITSAIYYADTRMKTEDNGFMGFPVCWNMVVFTLFIVSPSELLSFAVVVITAATTFMPGSASSTLRMPARTIV